MRGQRRPMHYFWPRQSELNPYRPRLHETRRTARDLRPERQRGQRPPRASAGDPVRPLGMDAGGIGQEGRQAAIVDKPPSSIRSIFEPYANWHKSRIAACQSHGGAIPLLLGSHRQGQQRAHTVREGRGVREGRYQAALRSSHIALNGLGSKPRRDTRDSPCGAWRGNPAPGVCQRCTALARA
jgi:hypothetical protein